MSHRESISYMYKENEDQLEQSHKVKALQCLVCKNNFFHKLNSYSTPKVLPQCGHTVCNVCIEQKLLPNNYNFLQPVSTNIECPICKTSNPISEKGIQNLPTNIALKNVAEFVHYRLEKIAHVSVGWHCPHLAMVDKPIFCHHCKGRYCSDCIIRHKETIRIEANFHADGLRTRCRSVSKWLNSNADSMEDMVEKQSADVVGAIVRSCDELERNLLAQIRQTKERLLAEAKHIRQQQLASVAHLKQIVALDPETMLRPKVDDLNSQSVLQVSLDSVVEVFKEALDYDASILDVERMARSGESLLGNIQFQPPCGADIGSLRCLVDKSSGCVKLNIPKFDNENRLPTTLFKLHDAIEAGHLVEVKEAFSRLPLFCIQYALKHFDFRNKGWHDGMLLLHQAAKYGHLNLVRFLVEEHHADAFARCLWGYNLHPEMPIHVAAEHGRLDVVRYLTDRWPQMATICDGVGSSALNEAAESGQLAVVKFLIEEKGVNPNFNASTYPAKSAWFSACGYGQLEIVRYLAETCQVRLRQVTDSFESAMHVAAERDELAVAKYLHRKDPGLVSWNERDCHDLPIHTAAGSGNCQTLRFLIEAGPQHIDEPTSYGMTPLMLAARAGCLECVRILITNNANPFFQTHNNQSAIHHAAAAGSVDVVKYLCEQRPELTRLKTLNNGSTPLSVAESKGQREVIDYLKPRTPNYYGY